MMKLRDELNSAVNYQKLLFKKKEYILEREKKLVDLYSAETQGIQLFPKPNVDVIQSTKDTILIYQNDLLILLYSIGEDVHLVRNQYYKTLESMQNVWRQSNGYVQMLWMLSIGIMLEIENSEFKRLVDLVENDNPQDFLVDFLIHSRFHTWEQSPNFKFPRPYKATKDIVEIARTNKDEALEKLTKYLQKEWYRGHSDMGWYDDHKSKWNIHIGYWSFESGALVKILGLDDSLLKDQQYYPYDMVHYKD